MTSSTSIVHGKGFQAEVIRSNRRKTAAVKVEAGRVSVVVPVDLPDEQIQKVITKKTRWIKEKLQLHQQYPPVKPKEYVSGESFSYLGRNYRLKVQTGATRSVKLLKGRLTVTLPRHSRSPEKVRESLTGWYRLHAEDKFQEKVYRYAKLIGVEPSSVGIKTFKSRWGSCSTMGDVVFNWQVIVAPNRIVDYVVVHELCHLKHHDHSPRFWKCVEQIIPDYVECKEWLKKNGKSLVMV